MTTYELGGAPMGLSTVMAAGRPGARVTLSGGAREKIEAARRVVERYAAGDEPIYGLNTGLGGNAQVLFEAIRSAGVPMLDEDRATGPDVDRVAALFETEEFSGRVEGLVARG